jgi:uncharacterized protein YegL
MRNLRNVLTVTVILLLVFLAAVVSVEATAIGGDRLKPVATEAPTKTEDTTLQQAIDELKKAIESLWQTISDLLQRIEALESMSETQAPPVDYVVVDQQCSNEGEFVVGFDANGTIICAASEPITSPEPSTTPICNDNDEDGYNGYDLTTCPSGLDWYDDDPNVYPGALELCDGKDNDQDSLVDWDDGCTFASCQVDVFLVLDETGSISSSDFRTLKDFTIELVNRWKYSPNMTEVGIVAFATDSRTILNLTNNKMNAINAIANMQQRGGATCTVCGIYSAKAGLDAYSRPEAKRVAIVITDGINNQRINELVDAISAFENAGGVLIAIGVGNVDVNQINQIASDIPGTQTAFFVSEYTTLMTIVDSLAIGTCQL